MDLPEHCITVYRVRVRFAETDLMGVVHHGSYVYYLESARVEYLRRRGITYLSWTDVGIHLAVVETRIRHRSPARFDDVITVETKLAELGKVQARFSYRLFAERSTGRELLADAETRLACVDSGQKLRRIPPEALAILTSPESVTPELLG
ncbi:MAG: thioesterase family protein [Polyangiaceae bacterium]|nr:thioesterase family protein [Polyangiaceae bacterium]